MAAVVHRASVSRPGGYRWSGFLSLLPLTRCLCCRSLSLTTKLLGFGLFSHPTLTYSLLLRLQQTRRQQLLMQARLWRYHLRQAAEPLLWREQSRPQPPTRQGKQLQMQARHLRRQYLPAV